MTWIKICGITNLEDALVAVEAGADAVGFVFYEKSPRCVSVETAREIVGKLPTGVEKVGVFSAEPSYAEITRQCGFDAVQKHIGISARPFYLPTAEDMRAISKLKNYWCVHYTTFVGEFAEQNLKGVAAGSPPGLWDGFYAIFIDSGTLSQPGGTGKAFNWREAAPAFKILNQHLRVVVAGGLNPENVGEAIEILHPWGVDVSSGVESRPGKKDPEKVQTFVRAVREIDKKTS